MQRQSLRSKITAVVTVVLFILANGLFPVPLRASAPLSVKGISINAAHLEIPPQIGNVDEMDWRGKGPAVIHIQSAHGHYEAEKNIQALLKYLNENQGIDLIFLEGGAGKLDPGLFNFFPSRPDLNLKLADHLLKKAELTGPELFLIERMGQTKGVRHRGLTSSDVQAYGVENVEAYRRNRHTFQQVLRQKEISDKFFHDLERSMKQIEDSVFNPALRNVLRFFVSYESSQKEIKPHLHFLKKQARRHLEIDLDDAFYQPNWPMLVRYFRMERIEPTDKDMQMLEKEKPTFLSYLGTIQLSPEVLSQIREILDVNTRDTERTVSGMSVRAVFERMMVSLPEDFDFAAYENVRLYIQYLILQEELDVAMFNRETDQLKRELLDKLAHTAVEKRMVSYYEEVKLLRKMVNLELTREEYERILKREKGRADQSLRPSYLMKHLGAIGGKAIQKELERVEVGSIDVLYDQALGFYKGAIERERFMEEEMASVMKAKRARQVVLVTGGFHAEGMKDYLISRGLSYVRLSPHISEIHEDNAYRRAMLETSQISNILKLQHSEIRQSLAGHDAYERYYARLLNEARQALALTRLVQRSEVRHTFDEYELKKFLRDVLNKKPNERIEDLFPLKVKLRGQFKTATDPEALAQWVIKNREGFLWERMSRQIKRQELVKNRQELQIFIPYAGGFLPSQIDRGKFMALFFFIANTYIDYFVPLDTVPENRPDQPYGFLLTDDKGNLGYAVDLSPDISEKNLAIMLRHIQLFNAGMLLASAEEASRLSNTGTVPDVTDHQMKMAAQAYRNFENNFVSLLRDYNQYRDPAMLYELKQGDLAGRQERHKARAKALRRYRLEEVLYPNYPWLVPVAESARNRNRMLPLWYGIEGMMLNTELLEAEGRGGEETVHFRGKEFIERTRSIGYEAIELMEKILDGTGSIPLASRMHFDPFIDVEIHEDATRDYLQKMTNALAQGRMVRKRLPDPQTFDGAVNYYKIKPDVQPLTSAEPAKAIPETESPDVEEKAKDPVTLRRIEEIRNAVRQNPANATAYDFRLLLETLKDPNREVREAALTALPYFLTEKPSLRSLMLPYRRQIEKALGEHFGIIKALKDRPDEASLADLMDVGIMTSNKRIDPTRDIDSLAQSLIDRPGRPPVDTLLVSVPFDTGRLPSQIDRAKFIALFLFVSSTDLDHFRPLNPSPERSRRTDTFFGRIDQRIEDFIEFLEDLVFGTIYDFLVKIKIIKEPVIPQGILHRPDTDKGEERGLMYRFHLSENTDLPREAEEMNLKRYLRMVQVLDLGLFLASAEESYQVFFPGEVPAWMRSQRLRALAQVYRAFEQRIVWLLREYDAYLDPEKIPDTDKKDLQKYRQAMKEAFGRYRLSEILYPSRSWEAKDWKKLINLVRVVEGMMILEGTGDREIEEGVTLTRGQTFINRMRAVGSETAKLMEHLLGAKDEEDLASIFVNITSYIPRVVLFEPFIDSKVSHAVLQAKKEIVTPGTGDIDAQLDYVLKIKEALERREISRADLPVPELFTPENIEKMLRAFSRSEVRTGSRTAGEVSWPETPVSWAAAKRMAVEIMDGIVAFIKPGIGAGAAASRANEIYNFIYRDRLKAHRNDQLQIDNQTAPVSLQARSLLSVKDDSFGVISIQIPEGLKRSEIREALKEFGPVLRNHPKKILVLNYTGYVPEKLTKRIYREYEERAFVFGNQGSDLLNSIYSPAKFSRLPQVERQNLNRFFSRASSLRGGSPLTPMDLIESSLAVAPESFFRSDIRSQIAKQFIQKSLTGISPQNLFRAYLFFALDLSGLKTASTLKEQYEDLEFESHYDILRFFFKSDRIAQIQDLLRSVRSILTAA